jgi:hypothetical protein
MKHFPSYYIALHHTESVVEIGWNKSIKAKKKKKD